MGIIVQEPSFSILPPTDHMSYFEDDNAWGCLEDGLDAAVSDTTLLLDQYHLPTDSCTTLVADIIEGTTSVLVVGLFNLDSLVGPIGFSVVVLALSVDCDTNLYTKGNN